MVEGTRLESGRTLIAYREFESLPLRHENEGASRPARSFVVLRVCYGAGVRTTGGPASCESLGVAGKPKFEFVASTLKEMRPSRSGPYIVREYAMWFTSQWFSTVV